ncbi:MAG: VCBS repeat-containing protein [Deltaproteobacteria bacterium]|nr:VCBS repeat-containing protein [Deltaproteobacteria bacterium]
MVHIRKPRSWRLGAWAPLAVLTVTCLAAASGFAEDPLAWRWQWRDPQRTNFSPGTAHLAKPAVRWRAPLDSGANSLALVDVDLDGHDDLALAGGGRITARRADGTVLWKSAATGLNSVVRVGDLTGDGVPELLAIGARNLVLLHALSGEALWQSPAGLLSQVAGVWLADFDGDGVVDLAFADAGSPIGATTPKAHFYRFAGGKAGAYAKAGIPLPDGQFANTTSQHAMDLDGDDVADLLLAEQGLAAVSGKNGAVLGTSGIVGKLGIWPVAVASVAGAKGQPPLLVWAADNSLLSGNQAQVGWRVYRLEGGKLQVKWEFEAPDPVKESVRTMAPAIGDLDGDGVAELAVSHFVNGAWRLEAYDLATGATLTVSGLGGPPPAAGQPGPVLQGAFVDGSQAVLVLAQHASRSTPEVAPLQLATWTRKGGFALLADLGVGTWWPANVAPPPTLDGLWRTPRRPLRSLSTGLPASEVLVVRDTDFDTRADHLDRLMVGAGGQVQLLGSLAFAPTTRLLGLAAGNGLGVVGARSDGRVAIWNSAFTLQNDGDGDGQPDLQQRVGGSVTLSVARRGPEKLPMFAATSGAQAYLFDPAGAGPAKPPKLLWSASPSANVQRAVLVDSDGDGDVEVAIRSWTAVGNARIDGFGQDGKVKWSWQWPSPSLRWDLTAFDPIWGADLDGDGAEELYLQAWQLAPVSPAPQLATVLSGKSHAALWQPSAYCAGVAGVGVTLDSTSTPPRMIASGYYVRTACNALSGDKVNVVEKTNGSYGLPMMVDLDGAPPLDYVVGGAFAHTDGHVGADMQVAWHVADTRVVGQPALVMGAGAQARMVQQVGAKSELDARDAKTGALLWSRVYLGGKAWPVDAAPEHSQTISGLAGVADLTGQGVAAGLFASSEGLLYAVALQDGAVLWTLDMGGQCGPPIPADVDGDGLLEVLVVSPEGDLLALDSDVAEPPAWVREHGPAGPALSDAEDLDQQEDAEHLAGNWAAVAGANGYAVRLLDDSGGEIVPPTLTVANKIDLTGLYLQPDRTYHLAVASHASQGNDASYSTEAASDGIQVVDVSPPWFEGVGCQPACAVTLGQAVQVVGKARDHTRLQAVAIQLTSAGSTVAQAKWPWFGSQFPVDWPLPPLAEGLHQVKLHAVDLAGHSSETTVTVQVCKAPAIVGAPACSTDQPKGTKEVIGINGTHAEGCAAGPTAGRGWWPLLSLTAVALLLGRLWRRPRRLTA